jgi:hypothetical protein
VTASVLVRRALSAARPGDRRASHDDGVVACDLVAVRHQKQLIGWLGCLRPGGGSQPEVLEVLNGVAPIISIELTTRAQERIGDRRVVGRLLEIVRSGVADPIVLGERLGEVHLVESRLVAAVWVAGAAEHLRHALPRAVIGEAGGRCYVLGDEPDRLAELAIERRLACGIGSVVPLHELSRSLVEAEAAYAIAAVRGGVATWRDLASLATLLGQQPADRLAAFATQLVLPIVEYDAKHGIDLLATLRTFIEEEGAVEATARRVGVHANSLRYRLRRIRTLTGRDPFVFLDRVALYVGLWAWDTQHRRSPQALRRLSLGRGRGSMGRSRWVGYKPLGG